MEYTRSKLVCVYIYLTTRPFFLLRFNINISLRGYQNVHHVLGPIQLWLQKRHGIRAVSRKIRDECALRDDPEEMEQERGQLLSTASSKRLIALLCSLLYSVLCILKCSRERVELAPQHRHSDVLATPVI